ncbi:MAG: phosphatidylglycerol:prolipoprotein diacylglycerol transferase [Candidatus Azotimanducaceae bacterium]|jgi:phosphatidylglycerol:prolipoprotein diacylglycerol transferase
MWQYPELDPVAISLGPISIHWYAISYLVGIGLVWWVSRYRTRVYGPNWTEDDLADILFYAVLGVLLGGRMGYMLFYSFETVLENPFAIFKVWEGGMSFHGGLIGVLLGMVYFARTRSTQFFTVTDFIAISIPIALGIGRLGNFVNTELPGRASDVPWAIVFPGEDFGRHPSSLYQAFLEGPVLFGLMWLYASKPRPIMAVSGMFLLGYGSLRLVSEMFREPDQHIGFVLFDSVTTGQMLSLPMALIGVGFITLSYLRKK